jgi:hypothetical protein
LIFSPRIEAALAWHNAGMAKPVKKPRASSDPNLSAADMVRRSFEAHDAPAPVKSFKDELSAYMAKLGKKGGKASGAKRMENLSKKTRRAIAKKAAVARWKDHRKD